MPVSNYDGKKINESPEHIRARKLKRIQSAVTSAKSTLEWACTEYLNIGEDVESNRIFAIACKL